jgi:hypothetical protein
MDGAKTATSGLGPGGKRRTRRTVTSVALVLLGVILAVVTATVTFFGRSGLAAPFTRHPPAWNVVS